MAAATDSPSQGPQLKPGLAKLLNRIRREREPPFNPAAWIQGKCQMFNDYMRNNNLKACVVSLSGGIDSAVTLGLMQRASTMENSPIERVAAIMQPIHSSDWAQARATEIANRLNQLNTIVGTDEAKDFSPDSLENPETLQNASYVDPCGQNFRELAYAPPAQKSSLTNGVESFVIDQTPIYDALKGEIDRVLNIPGGKFAGGQLRSYMRTPSAYYVAQLISQGNESESVPPCPCVVMGTGNKDEDGYLAYFCKAGDGVVDVQLIADLHKSQVYAIGRCLGLPLSVLEAPPSADLWDNQTDEEELGFSYNFIELFVTLLRQVEKEIEGQQFGNEAARDDEIMRRLAVMHGLGADSEDGQQFESWGRMAMGIHKRNRHKIGGAVNLNLIED